VSHSSPAVDHYNAFLEFQGAQAMRQVIRQLISIAGASAAGLGATACAEVPDMSLARMQEIASHIFTGKVVQIYAAVDRSTPSWETHLSVAEIRIDRIEKGKHDSRLAYVRFSTKRFVGGGAAPPGAYGQRGVPKVGAMVRAYVVGDEDGGFNALEPNGLTSPSAAAKSDRPD
jgi:hypothetical protein